jgi:hypothetical protein
LVLLAAILLVFAAVLNPSVTLAAALLLLALGILLTGHAPRTKRR